MQDSPYPLRFRPLIKQTIWGGRKLGDMLGKPIGAENNYAESWELVDHGDDQSVVTNGPLAGTTLQQLLARAPEWVLGSDAQEPQFPLLLKYLDCNRVLSVQVHPDDQYGATLSVPDRGKTEAWYVVDAEPESVIYAGLKSGVDRAALADAMAAGETDRVLHAFHPEPGDCVFIPAGTVHALGAGLVIAEIQQSSDTTFRLFDWNRVGADGQPRPLHIEQSLDVTDYASGPVHARKSNRELAGLQNLVSCDKFTLSVLERGDCELKPTRRCQILTVPRGTAVLHTPDETVTLQCGQTVLLPAAMPACELSVQADATALIATP